MPRNSLSNSTRSLGQDDPDTFTLHRHHPAPHDVNTGAISCNPRAILDIVAFSDDSEVTDSFGNQLSYHSMVILGSSASSRFRAYVITAEAQRLHISLHLDGFS